MKAFTYALLVLVASACFAQETELRISGYHDGTLSFNQISNAAYYRIDWSPTPHGPWSRTWANFQSIKPNESNNVISVEVPKFYRVLAIMKGTLYGLIAHYAFHEQENERVTDQTGRGNYGTIHGATWVATNAMGGAFSFDGVDDYIELGRSDLYQQTQGELSGCVWMNRKSRHIIFLSNYRGGGAYAGQFMFEIDGAGVLDVMMGQGVDEGIRYMSAGADLIPSNEWHHVAFTYNEQRGAGNRIKLFIDGVGVTNVNAITEGNGGPILGVADQLRIMAHRAPLYSKGLIHELMLFDRCLTDEEVKDIFNNH